jgi:hypothetical protein
MSAPRVRRAAAAALALAAGAASACGVCVEDKVAAAYDHSVVSHAAARGQVVVFAEPAGGGQAGRTAARLKAAAAKARGVDPSSVRASTAPAALSFALDPRVATPAQALAAIARSAGIPGLRLSELRVLP